MQAFAEKLQKAVETAQVAEPRDVPSLSAELARLKVMRDEGLLTEAQFEAGKNKLLETEPDKKNGILEVIRNRPVYFKNSRE